MAITVELPPQMAKEAQDYVVSQGTTIEQLLFDHLKADLAKRDRGRAAMARLDALVEKFRPRLTGEAYKFNRADAYEPERAFA